MKNDTPKNAVKILLSSRDEILKYLSGFIQSGRFDYRTFGTDIENRISAIIINIFKEAGFIKNTKDYVLAPHKNYFPDFELKTRPPLAIEFKSGNRRQKLKGQWVSVTNSENDMGTLNEWPKKIKKFGGENIFYIFVIYNLNNTVSEISDVQIAPFYRFIGLNKEGLFKYREKDGNLRPKDFDASPPIKTFEQFRKLFKKTIVYRSKRIIQKHRLIIRRVSQDP